MDQPTTNIALPQDVLDAVQIARDNIAELQTQAQQLDRTNRGLNKTNVDIQAYIDYLSQQEKQLSISVDTLQNQVNDLTNQISELQTKVDFLTVKSGSLTVQIGQQQADMDNREKDMSMRNADLVNKEQDLNNRIKSLEVETNIFNEKKNSLTNFLSTL